MDDIVQASKEASYGFRRRLGELTTPMELRSFVDDYFHTPERKMFWWNVSAFYDLDGGELWGDEFGKALKVLLISQAFEEWSKEKASFKDERVLLGFKLGSTVQR